MTPLKPSGSDWSVSLDLQRTMSSNSASVHGTAARCCNPIPIQKVRDAVPPDEPEGAAPDDDVRGPVCYETTCPPQGHGRPDQSENAGGSRSRWQGPFGESHGHCCLKTCPLHGPRIRIACQSCSNLRVGAATNIESSRGQRALSGGISGGIAKVVIDGRPVVAMFQSAIRVTDDHHFCEAVHRWIYRNLCEIRGFLLSGGIC